MKITKKYLQQVIKEELEKIEEIDGSNSKKPGDVFAARSGATGKFTTYALILDGDGKTFFATQGREGSIGKLSEVGEVVKLQGREIKPYMISQIKENFENFLNDVEAAKNVIAALTTTE